MNITTRDEARRARSRLEVLSKQEKHYRNIIARDGDAWSDETVAAVVALTDTTDKKQLISNSLEAFEELESKRHPLARTVDLNSEVRPPDWVIPNFIAEGIVLIAGGHGVGKTTTIIPLAMTAAGVHETDYELKPSHWRKVIYITEDVAQAKLIINGWANSAGLDREKISERFHLVEALRMPPRQVIQVGDHYRKEYSRAVETTNGTVELAPLVVIDTMSSTFLLENENDNSEASTMIAALKQQFKLPVWIVGHVSKGDLSRQSLNGSTPSLRGASAFEADANQVIYLTKEKDGSRWLVRGKSRFESPWYELMIDTGSRTYPVQNRFGETETLTQRWGIARPAEKSREDISREAREQQDKYADQQTIDKICDFIGKAEGSGKPVTKSEVVKSVTGRATSRKEELVAHLLDQNRIAIVTLSPEVTGRKRAMECLLLLSEGERAELSEKGAVPAARISEFKSNISNKKTCLRLV